MEKATTVQDKEAPLIEHLRELALRLRKVVLGLLITTAVYFFVGFKVAQVNGVLVPVPQFSLYHSIAAEFMRAFIAHDLAGNLRLLTLNPFDPLYAGLVTALFLALLTNLPLMLYEFWAFVSPGLYEHEKKLFKNTIVPAFLLFLAGAAFAYFVIVPVMMYFTYEYDVQLGVEPTLSLRSYVDTVMKLMGGVGLAFEAPLIMTGLTYLGVVKAEDWSKNWRFGVAGAWIIAWMISPGTTGGLIETTIGVTLSSLYFAGVLASKYVEKRAKKVKANA